MTKTRILPTGRQITLDKARAVKRARNGEIEACLTIIRKHINQYIDVSASRYILPTGIIGKIKDEIKGRKQ